MSRIMSAILAMASEARKEMAVTRSAVEEHLTSEEHRAQSIAAEYQEFLVTNRGALPWMLSVHGPPPRYGRRPSRWWRARGAPSSITRRCELFVVQPVCANPILLRFVSFFLHSGDPEARLGDQ